MLVFYYFRDSFISMMIRDEVSETLSNDISYLSSEEKGASKKSDQKKRKKNHTHTHTHIPQPSWTEYLIIRILILEGHFQRLYSLFAEIAKLYRY